VPDLLLGGAEAADRGGGAPEAPSAREGAPAGAAESRVRHADAGSAERTLSHRAAGAAAVALAGAALAGCFAYELPALPPLADASAPSGLVCVLAPPTRASGFPVGWSQAAHFAAELEDAGFSPCIVSKLEDVPPGAPVVENYVHPSPSCGSTLTVALSGLTLGVFPAVSCLQFGHRFDLRAAADAEPQPIDTRYEVPVVYGWLVAPLLALPDYDAALPDDMRTERERAALRAAIVEALGRWASR
jgi:hypothetical protein